MYIIHMCAPAPPRPAAIINADEAGAEIHNLFHLYIFHPGHQGGAAQAVGDSVHTWTIGRKLLVVVAALRN